MCHFTSTKYSCGHQGEWVADKAGCPRIAAEKAVGRQTFFLACPAPDPKDLHIVACRIRCHACHQRFLSEQQRNLMQALHLYNHKAGDDHDLIGRVAEWFGDVCEQVDTLAPLWYETTVKGTRDIYEEYPRWVLGKLRIIRERFTKWSDKD